MRIFCLMILGLGATAYGDQTYECSGRSDSGEYTVQIDLPNRSMDVSKDGRKLVDHGIAANIRSEAFGPEHRTYYFAINHYKGTAYRAEVYLFRQTAGEDFASRAHMFLVVSPNGVRAFEDSVNLICK